MYVLLAYGLGILTFYLLWYKKPFQTIWEIAGQIIYEERKFFPTGYTLNKKDVEIEDLNIIGINVILFYFRTLPRTFIWDSNKNRVSGSVIKDINTIKDDLEKSNLANRHLSQREANQLAQEKLRTLGVDVNE